MSKEHKTLTEFFAFLANKQEDLEGLNAENTIQEYYDHRLKEVEKAKEEKKLKQLKKLELIAKKREEQKKRAKTPKEKLELSMQSKRKQPKIKTMKEMQALIDRIRN